jgi:PAS domain S-box-containing protein
METRGPHPATAFHAEANLRALIESTEDLLWSVDLNYRLQTFNSALSQTFERSFGVRAAVGMRPEDLLPPARAALFPPLYERVLSEGPFRAEYTLLDGRTLELAFSRIVQDGETTGISVFGKDITERQAVENTLLAAETQYRDMFEGAVEGIYRVSLEGKPLAANPAIARMLGYDSPAEALSAVVDVEHQVWLDPNDRSHLLQLLETREVVTGFQCRLKRKDGSVLWVSLNCRRLRGVDGGLLGYEGFIEDITGRKEAEVRLQAQTARFQRIVENTDAGYFRIGMDGCYEDVNPAWLQMHGFTSREEAIGLHFSAVQVPGDAAKAEEVAKAVMRGGSIKSVEFSRLCRDGTTGYHRCSAHPVLDGDRVIGIEGCLVDISEHGLAGQIARQANDALAKAERHYRLIFNSISDPVFVTKIGDNGVLGEFIDFNDSACRYLGYSREELQRKRIYEITARESLPQVPALASATVSGQPLTWEGVHLAKGGRRIPVEVGSNVVDIDGALAVIATVRDITERRDAETRYRGLFEGALEGVYRISVHGRFLAVNPALVSILGYDSAEEVISSIGDSFHRLWLDPSERLRFTELVEADGVVQEYECQLRRKDSSVIWVLLNGRKVCGENGGTLCYEGFISDITEHRRAVDTLRESERRLRAVVETVSMIGITLDPQGNITLCNDYLLALTGWKREEVLGQNWFEIFIPPEIYEELYREIFLKTIGTGELPVRYQSEIITRAGERRTVEWNNTMIRDLGGQVVGVACIGADITERKQAEESLQKANRQLHQLSSDLLRSQDYERRRIARELHDSTAQLLAALSINLSRLRDSELEPDRRRQALSESIDLAAACSAEIRTVTYLLHPPLLDEVGLAEALQSYAQGFNQRTGIQIEIRIPPDFGRLSSEMETTLFRIVQEGLANVHRHSGSPLALILLERDPREVRLVLQDRGRGFPEALNPQRKGFVRFGVGIMGMRERAEQLGGRLELSSNDAGTTLTVILPLVHSHEKDADIIGG